MQKERRSYRLMFTETRRQTFHSIVHDGQLVSIGQTQEETKDMQIKDNNKVKEKKKI